MFILYIYVNTNTGINVFSVDTYRTFCCSNFLRIAFVQQILNKTIDFSCLLPFLGAILCIAVFFQVIL